MPTKNGNRIDDLRPKYDLKQLRRGTRGKYFARASAGMTLVVLEPDVAEAFPSSQAVNEALRALARVARTHGAGHRKLPDKPLQPTSRKRRQAKQSRVARAARG